MNHFALTPQMQLVRQLAPGLCNPCPKCSPTQLHMLKSIRTDLAEAEHILARAAATLAALLAKSRLDDIRDEGPELNHPQPGNSTARWVTAIVPTSKDHFGILRHNVSRGPTERSTDGSLDSGVSGKGYTKLQLLPALRKLSLRESEIISILKPLPD
jgi:hypothetical protein